MKVVKSVQEYNSNKQSIVTIGTFDGIHLGHQKILKNLVKESKKYNLESLVLTFENHPRKILDKDFQLKLLTTNKEKIEILEKIGIESIIFQTFDKEFSELPGKDFVKKILVDQLNIKKIIIGYDHRFGKGRQCGIDDLIQFGKEFDFEVEQISAEEVDENKVSSTKIRNAISNGDIITANKYLGYEYSFSGKVIKGKQLGRTIGFPTANIMIAEVEKIIPKKGVYVVEGSWDGNKYQGMMNIGVKPTVDGHTLSVEVNFFDLDQDLYDKIVTIHLRKFIREEKKFESLDYLKLQIQNDKVFAINYFNSVSNN